MTNTSNIPPVSLNENSMRAAPTSDVNSRELLTSETLKHLRTSLRFTLGLSAVVFASDLAFIWMKFIQPADRVMNADVVKVFIGATVVQVGAAYAVIIAAVFKGNL